MIQLSDHGGAYGGGKYRKDSLVPLKDTNLPEYLVFLIGVNYKRGICSDSNYLYVCDDYAIKRINLRTKLEDPSWNLYYATDAGSSNLPMSMIIIDGVYYVLFTNGKLGKFTGDLQRATFMSIAMVSNPYNVQLYHYNGKLYCMLNNSTLAIYTVDKTTGVTTNIFSKTIGSNYYNWVCVDQYVYYSDWSSNKIASFNLSTLVTNTSIFGTDTYNSASILDFDRNTGAITFLNRGTNLIKRVPGSTPIYSNEISADNSIVGRIIYNSIRKKYYIFEYQTLRIINATTGAKEFEKVMYGSIYKNSGQTHSQILQDGSVFGNFALVHIAYNDDREIPAFLMSDITLTK